MKGNTALRVLMLLLTLVLRVQAENQNVPPKLQNEIEKVTKFANDEVLIHAVQTQNKAGVTIKEIHKLDRDWARGTISQDFVKSLMENACAVRLKEQMKQIPSSLESFVMDNQGALVCTTQKTSDYWQGDEAKWTDSFKSGIGATVVSKRQYDESSKSTLIHVSVPIMELHKAIGVLCVGINLTKLAEESSQ